MSLNKNNHYFTYNRTANDPGLIQGIRSRSNFVNENPSPEAGKEIIRLLHKPKIHYRTEKSTSKPEAVCEI
jgi:hypothetical protein